MPLDPVPVAQLDSASASGAEGYRFESCRGYLKKRYSEELLRFLAEASRGGTEGPMIADYRKGGIKVQIVKRRL